MIKVLYYIIELRFHQSILNIENTVSVVKQQRRRYQRMINLTWWRKRNWKFIFLLLSKNIVYTMALWIFSQWNFVLIVICWIKHCLLPDQISSYLKYRFQSIKIVFAHLLLFMEIDSIFIKIINVCKLPYKKFSDVKTILWLFL